MIFSPPSTLDAINLEVTKQEWNFSLLNHTSLVNMDKDETVDGNEDSKWQDLPMELLMCILKLVDDHTIIIGSGVCTGQRGAICIGVQEIYLSW